MPIPTAAQIDAVLFPPTHPGEVYRSELAPLLKNLAAGISALQIAPANLVAPSISGSKNLGSVLTVSSGGWKGAPEPGFSYAWKRSGTAISGATANTYTITAADQGLDLTAAVTASNDAGSAVASATVSIPAAVTQLALNTPILFEGDSNTDTGFSLTSWAKTAVLEAGSRYYQPPHNNYAGAGGNVSTISNNSMEYRKDTVVARIQQMVAAYGRCVLWFQIGTNGPGSRTNQQSIDDLAAIVAAYRNAGAKVYANTCPTYGSSNTDPTDYRNMLNAWIKAGTNVDGWVDVNTVITAADTGDATHYNDSGKDKVGKLAGAKMASLIVSTSIYDDGATALFTSDFAGSGGFGEGQTVNGPIGSGWRLYNVYNKNVSVTASKVQVDGSDGQRLVLSAVEDAFFVFDNRNIPLSVSSGQAMDFMAKVQLVSGDVGLFFYADDGNAAAGFPAPDSTAAPLTSAYWNRPYIWRPPLKNPQTAATTTAQIGFLIDIKAGKTATIDIAKVRGVLRPA